LRRTDDVFYTPVDHDQQSNRLSKTQRDEGCKIRRFKPFVDALNGSAGLQNYLNVLNNLNGLKFCKVPCRLGGSLSTRSWWRADKESCWMNADVNNPTNRTLAVIDGGLSIDAGVRPTATSPKPKLLDRVREAIRTRHHSEKTEERMCTGSNGTYFFTSSGIRWKWPRRRSANFFRAL
jgi:hypothetical protein